MKKQKSNKKIKNMKVLVDLEVEYIIQFENNNFSSHYYSREFSGKDTDELIDKMALKLTKDQMPIEELRGEIFVNSIRQTATIFGKKIDRKLADIFFWDLVIFMDDKEVKSAIRKSKFYGAVKKTFKERKIREIERQKKELNNQVRRLNAELSKLRK